MNVVGISAPSGNASASTAPFGSGLRQMEGPRLTIFHWQTPTQGIKVQATTFTTIATLPVTGFLTFSIFLSTALTGTLGSASYIPGIVQYRIYGNVLGQIILFNEDTLSPAFFTKVANLEYPIDTLRIDTALATQGSSTAVNPVNLYITVEAVP